MKKVQKDIATGRNFVHAPNMTFAEKLQNLITKRRMTRAEAAKFLGFSERAFYFWLSGGRTPKPATQEGVLARLKRNGAKR